VAPAESRERVRQVYDEVVCLHTPEPYYAVGQWYTDFHQVTDDEVRGLLETGKAAGESGNL
jgi:predicted phosphoribosyltransferase